MQVPIQVSFHDNENITAPLSLNTALFLGID